MMNCSLCHSNNPPEATRCRACGSALKTRLSGNAATPDALPSGALLANTYAVEEVLGQGGFGITYRCHDQMLDRLVAVKEFFPAGCRRQEAEVQASRGLSQAGFGEARAQFLAEARTLARLHHVGIVGVYAAFEANATAYMVMELLHGKTLAQLLQARGGAMNEAEAVGVMERVGEALAFVHGQNLLHRDIKPDNIIVCDDGRVMLIDFGTARETIAGQVQGHTVVVTPGYAPLEQYAKQARRGPFTDVYSIAATLYHLLAGAMPPAASDRAMGVQLRPVRELKPQISPSVAGAVERALQMEIDKRPQSVREFLDLLHAPVEDAPFGISPASQAATVGGHSLPANAAEIAALPAFNRANSPSLALFSDSLQAQQTPIGKLLPDLKESASEPPLNPAPVALFSDALQEHQKLVGTLMPPADPQPVKLEPPRAFSQKTNPPKAATPKAATPKAATPKASAPPLSSLITPGDSNGVKVRYTPDKSDNGIWWGFAGSIAFLGLLILLGSGKSRTPATSPSSYSIEDSSSSSVYSPPFNPVPNTSQNDSMRRAAEQAWDALPITLPASINALPVSPNLVSAPMNLPSQGNGIEFSLDGKRLAYVDGKAVLRVLSLPNRKLVRTLKLDEKYPPVDILFAPDNQTIAVTERVNDVQRQGATRTEIWSLRTAKRTGVLSSQQAENHGFPSALTNDGQLLLRPSNAPNIKGGWSIWNRKTGKINEAPFDIPTTAAVTYSVMSPDGKTFVVGDELGRLRWLDLKTGKQINDYTMPMSQGEYFEKLRETYGRNSSDSSRVFGVDYSLNGQFLASRNSGGITVFDSKAHEVGWLAIDSTSMFFSMSPDGNWLAAVGSLPYSPKGTLLWNAKTEKKIRLQTPYDNMCDFGFSPDGKQLYGIFSDNEKLQFVTWNVDAKAARTPKLFSRAGHYPFDTFTATGKANFTVSQAARKIAVPSVDSIEIHEFNSGTLQIPMNPATSEIVFSPDGKLLVGRGRDNGVQLLNASNGELIRQLSKAEADSSTAKYPNVEAKNARSMAFSADNGLLAFVRSNGDADVVELWSVKGQPYRLTSLNQREAVNVLTFSPDGKSLICGGEKGLLQWIDVKTRKLKSQSEIGEPIFDIAFAARNLVVMGESDSFLYQVPANAANAADPLQKAMRAKLEQSFNQGRDIYTPATISPDGKLLATAQGYKDLQIWELPSGRKLQALQNGRDSSSTQTAALTFSADSTEVTSIWRKLGSRAVVVSTYRRADAK